MSASLTIRILDISDDFLSPVFFLTPFGKAEFRLSLNQPDIIIFLLSIFKSFIKSLGSDFESPALSESTKPDNLLDVISGSNLIPSLGFKPPAFVNIILDSWASTPSF
jgi:hypothetical protein